MNKKNLSVSSDRSRNNVPIKALIAAIFSVISLTSCANPPFASVLETKSVDITSLLDTSQSSDNSTFRRQTALVCEVLTANIQRGDNFVEIPVSAVAPNRKSPVSVSPKLLEEECGKRKIAGEQGTLTKPAFEQALSAIAASNAKPLLIVHVNSNEKEDPDPVSLWQKVAKKVTERGGVLIFVGATNQGGEAFNAKIDKALGNFPNVIFAEEQNAIRQQISTAFKKLRK